MNSARKIVILLGDGMGDYPIDSLGGRTPLEAARTPNMDRVARMGILGLARSVPEGMQPGSDTANMAILGYDPSSCYTGRAPLEALNMGIELGPEDVAFRCNLVTLEGGILKDFSADHIDTDLTREVIAEIAAGMKSEHLQLYAGVSYRNILVWRNFPHVNLPETTPPHDIQDLEYERYLPRGEGSETLSGIMELSRRVIADSRKIAMLRERYRGNPTGAWLWGCGRRPKMPSLYERFGLKGRTISAVDLIHGLGRAVGLEPLHVEGATGYIDTNYGGKARSLVDALRTCNFVFLHVEAPDESGHEGNLAHKMKAIEDFDEKVVGPVLEGLSNYDDYSVMVITDHFTPVSVRTHTSEPVPFAMYHSGMASGQGTGAHDRGFNEASAARTGIFADRGHELMDYLVNKKTL